MGDRGNIVIRDGRRDRFVYTHWSGYRVGFAVQDAFTEVDEVNADSIVEYLMGNLMSAYELADFGDLGEQSWNPVVLVDCDTETVSLHRIGEPLAFGWESEQFGPEWSIAEFLLLADPDKEIRPNSPGAWPGGYSAAYEVRAVSNLLGCFQECYEQEMSDLDEARAEVAEYGSDERAIR